MQILTIYLGATMHKGTLYLIPTLLSEVDPRLVLPEGTLSVIQHLSEFIAEDERNARRFLIRAGIKRSINEIVFHVYNEHTSREMIPGLLEGLHAGKNVGLLSDAGVPCVADPGALIVMQAHLTGITVVPLTGPSSILLALMASGLNGQGFAFHGYLPADRNGRVIKLKELERIVKSTGNTQIFIETPYRNLQMLESIIQCCSDNILLCIACDLTSEKEFISTRIIGDWKHLMPEIGKRPAIFLLGR
jgi:16S rRNA (cytidine1402-2'-O)-methyltransferase